MTSVKLWFSSITKNTCVEWGTSGAGAGAGVGDGAGPGAGVGFEGAGAGAGVDGAGAGVLLLGAGLEACDVGCTVAGAVCSLAVLLLPQAESRTSSRSDKQIVTAVLWRLVAARWNGGAETGIRMPGRVAAGPGLSYRANPAAPGRTSTGLGLSLAPEG